jgi:hypothetical protein
MAAWTLSKHDYCIFHSHRVCILDTLNYCLFLLFSDEPHTVHNIICLLQVTPRTILELLLVYYCYCYCYYYYYYYTTSTTTTTTTTTILLLLLLLLMYVCMYVSMYVCLYAWMYISIFLSFFPIFSLQTKIIYKHHIYTLVLIEIISLFF